MNTLRVNGPLLALLGDLTLQAGSARVTLRSGEYWRSLEISHGELRGADGNFAQERIGQILVGLGWLDPALVQPILAEATAHKRTLGAQLIIDGLSDATKIAEGLRLQGQRRFEATLTADGTVERAPHQPGLGGLQRPIGAAVLAAFRDQVPIEAVTELLHAGRPARASPANQASIGDQLEMKGPEARVWRRLTKGESPRAIMSGSGGDQTVWRFLAALLAMGLIDWR